jgi:hypothetical protein
LSAGIIVHRLKKCKEKNAEKKEKSFTFGEWIALSDSFRCCGGHIKQARHTFGGECLVTGVRAAIDVESTFRANGG